MFDFGNLITAMVTPFTDTLEVDYKRMQELAIKLIEEKSTGLLISGTTGESPTLSQEEKLKLLTAVKEVVKGKVPIMLGTGSYNTRESIHFSKLAEELGADALLLVNPYYNKPDQRGLYEHFKAIANSVSLPIVLYNHPGRTGVTIEPQTLIKLAKIDNIVGLKDSSGSLDLVSQYIKSVPKDFKIYSGDDPLNLPMQCLGASGAISVASHIAGREISELLSAIDKGDLEKAREIHYSLYDLYKVLFCSPSPSPTKTALKIMGFPVGGVRLPLTELTEEKYNKVELILNKFKETYRK